MVLKVKQFSPCHGDQCSSLVLQFQCEQVSFDFGNEIDVQHAKAGLKRALQSNASLGKLR